VAVPGIYQRTDSAALTGLAYSLTFLPYFAGPLLAGVADRRPRRSVLVALDLARAAAMAIMALPGMRLPVMGVLLVAVTMVSPLYDAARSAMLPELLPADVYPTGLAVLTITTEAAQVLGFALGGVLVATLGARSALSVDALTFLVAALAVTAVISKRPAAYDAPESRATQLRAAVGLVFGSPTLRGLLALAWLNAMWVVPEGLVAPYAASLHAGAAGIGLLLAAIPFGCVVGAGVLVRLTSHEQRVRLMRPFAICTGLPLVACALRPGLPASLMLWALCGVGTAYNVAANAAFVRALPNERRSQAIALATTGMVTGQGLTILLAGVVASVVPPWTVIAVTGVLGTVIAALICGSRSSSPVPRNTARSTPTTQRRRRPNGSQSRLRPDAQDSPNASNDQVQVLP
jgi:predicted MFS family arabinose efflux permease